MSGKLQQGLATLMRDLQTLFGKNHKGFKSGVCGRKLALDLDQGAVLFCVHLQATPAQR